MTYYTEHGLVHVDTDEHGVSTVRWNDSGAERVVRIPHDLMINVGLQQFRERAVDVARLKQKGEPS